MPLDDRLTVSLKPYALRPAQGHGLGNDPALIGRTHGFQRERTFRFSLSSKKQKSKEFLKGLFL
jgi:hypothetical protein